MQGPVSIAGIYVYPVQSVRGEACPSATFMAAGIPGDRAYAIADLERNCIAHASHARKQYRPLITWGARYLENSSGPGGAIGTVELDFGDGSIRSDDTGIDRAISDRMGIAAAFVRNDGSRLPKLYEPSPCHLLTSATLRHLQEHYPAGEFDPARFRPNLYLDCGATSGFLEQEWMGCEVTIGSAVFEINDHCQRCALTTRAQGDLPADPGILQTAVRVNKTVAGMYAAVLQQGEVRVGDAVEVRQPPLAIPRRGGG